MAASIELYVYVLIPKQSFAFNLNARETYERLRDAPSDTAVHERLLVWLAECTDVNEAGIAILSRIYLAATICLMLQLASWAIAFLGTVY